MKNGQHPLARAVVAFKATATGDWMRRLPLLAAPKRRAEW